MLQWVKNLPVASASSSSNRGKTKSSDAQPSAGKPQQFKKPKFDRSDRVSALAQIVRVIGEGSAENARMLRQLAGIVLTSALVPDDAALHAATFLPCDPDDPILHHVQTWAIIETALASHPKVPSELKAILIQHANSVKDVHELATSVQYCHAQPTFKTIRCYEYSLQSRLTYMK
eukprot:TRINITY_DN81255_c0_g1_i1.p1 TRINITY_DN81255_c0_g1~~TRINITY_DN81255_c0_g1_i1.p1  ORF type:complete len:175 (-),score=17.26 TRINITY_DN81255_c0_g1_i1:260-784(-)